MLVSFHQLQHEMYEAYHGQSYMSRFTDMRPATRCRQTVLQQQAASAAAADSFQHKLNYNNTHPIQHAPLERGVGIPTASKQPGLHCSAG